MKKSILLNIAVFLTSICFSQVTITKKDFDKLVDYATCKYVQSFIEKNDTSKPYFKDVYIKKIKPEFEKVSLNNTPNYEKIKELLLNNEPALKLAEKINERKDKYYEFNDNESLLKFLKISKWGNIDLRKTASDIQNEVFAKYSIIGKKDDNKFAESDVDSAQTIQTTSQVKELQRKLDSLQEQYEKLTNDSKMIEYQRSVNRIKIFLFAGFGLLLSLILAVFILLRKLTSKDKIINYVLNSDRVAKKFNLKENVLQTISNSKSNKNIEPYKLTEADINLIVDRVRECMRLDEKEVSENKETNKKEAESLRNSYKYLKGKTGKIFSRAEDSSENSFFRLFDEHDDFALFEFYGDEAEAIANRIFSDDICNIISGNYQNAQKVITYVPGEVKRIIDQWEVIKPVQIKLV